MSVPSFNEIVWQVLKEMYVAQNRALTNKELILLMADHFSLSDDDLALRTKGGCDTQIYNRVQWSRNYLEAAGYAQREGRGASKITPGGCKFIESHRSISPRDFRRLVDEKRASRKNRVGEDGQGDSAGGEFDDMKTPEDMIGECLDTIKDELSKELLSEIMNQTPAFFEQLVVDLLGKIYGGEFKDNKKVTGRTGDDGIDGVIKQDRLGFDNIFIQAKRWATNVTLDEIKAFSGTLDEYRCSRGAFITTSDFTKPAVNYAEKIMSDKKIILVNGIELVKLMIEYEIGVKTKTIIVIKGLDKEYFEPNE